MLWNVSGSVHDKYQLHSVQRPEIALVQQHTLVAPRLQARIHSACSVNKTPPGEEEEQSPWQRIEARTEKNIYSNWHREGLEVCLPVSLKYSDLPGLLPPLIRR